MASIIRPRAPPPERGFIRAVGRAPTNWLSSPHFSTHQPIPFTTASMAPDARNTPMPTNMAIRYGIILMAVVKPSLAPSTNASYTLIFPLIPDMIKPIITTKRIMFAADVDTGPILTAGNCENPQIIRATIALNPPTKRIRTLSNLIFWIRQVASRPTRVEKNVASRMGMKTSAGCAAPICARYTSTLTGISVRPDVFKTRNMIIGFDATSLVLLSSCMRSIALRPIGVAALSSPSILAATFMNI